MWHHETSCTGVTYTSSAAAAVSEAAWEVMTATVAPLARAASMASRVALVPPSWETPMQTPPARGWTAASSAWRDSTRAVGWASASRAATAIAACSDVPQPTTTIGSPRTAAPATSSPIAVAAVRSPSSIASGRARVARIMSSITQGGPSRSSGYSSVSQLRSSLIVPSLGRPD